MKLIKNLLTRFIGVPLMVLTMAFFTCLPKTKKHKDK